MHGQDYLAIKAGPARYQIKVLAACERSKKGK